MNTLPIPIDRILVPASPFTVPDGFQRQQYRLLRGVPSDIILDAQVTLTLAVPTGLGTTWRDADVSRLVSSSEQGYAPAPDPASLPSEAGVPPNWLARPPARLLVRFSRRTAVAVPLVAGLRRIVADGGNPERGARMELIIIGWALFAGSLRGPGDFGSYLDVAWRRCEAGQSTYSIPPLDPRVAARLPPESTVLSEVGAKNTTPRSRLRRRGIRT
jgi:hypothetical protein